jgi:hypothetical protein
MLVKPNHPIHPDLHEKISVKVQGQLPQFVKEDHETFVSFMEAYYEYMEQVGKPYEIIGNLTSYANVDKTIDNFLQYFKKQFGEDIPEVIFQNSNKPFVIKHLRDFYRTKGSEKSFEFLFRLLYKEEIRISTPGQNILRTSDGKYRSDYVIRTMGVSSDYSKLEGKKVKGQTSGAVAIVESVVVEILGTFCVTTMSLSEIFGIFEANEVVSYDNISFIIGNMIIDTKVIHAGTGYEVNNIIPLVGNDQNSGALIRVSEVTSGSLSNVSINMGGTGYKVGDKLDIDNTNKLSLDGRSASLIVSEVETDGGIKTLWIENKGSGYISMPTVSGGSGTGANISFDLYGSGIGGIKSLDIINSGFGYNISPILNFSGNGDGTATAEVSIGGFDTTPKSRFINSDGFLSADTYLQDSFFYQLFSYEITSTENIRTWRDIVKRLVHPAGLAMFGKVQFISLLSLPLSITNIVPDTSDRYTIVFHDGSIKPPVILDLRLETCDEQQDIRTFIDSDNYGGFSLDDDIEDYQPLPDTLATSFSSEEDFQPSSETLSTVFSNEENYGTLWEPAATTSSHNIGCPGDSNFPFDVGICSPTDFGLITDNDTSSGQQDLDPEDYGRVKTPSLYFEPTMCQTYEQDLGVQKLTEHGGYDDYLYTYITPVGSYTGRLDTIEDYGNVQESATDKEDYGVVSYFNTFFSSQLKLGPILRTRDNTKFQSSYITSDNIDTVQRAVVFYGGDGYKIAPTVTIEAPVNGGTTALAQAYFSNAVVPTTPQIAQGDGTTTPIQLVKSVMNIEHITVSLNGLTQIPNTDYTVNDTTITFSEIVESTDSIIVYYLNYNEEFDFQGVQGDNTTTPLVLSQSVSNPQDIIVSLNGLTQIPNTDYTVNNTTITFDEVVTSDDYIFIQYLGEGERDFQLGQGNNTITPITLSQELSSNLNSTEKRYENVIITLNGIRQIPAIDYTIDGTILEFDEIVSSDENILVYYLDGRAKPTSPSPISGIRIIEPGSGYSYQEVPEITVAQSEGGEIPIASVVMLRGPYHNNIGNQYKGKLTQTPDGHRRNSDFLIFRGKKTNRVVDPILTQYKLISDPDNVDSFYEAPPPGVSIKRLKDDEILENI